MSNGTHSPDKLHREALDLCTTFDWCEAPTAPHAHHYGDADMAPVTATGDRNHVSQPDVDREHGIVVPLVQVSLTANTGTDEGPRTNIVLALRAPDQEPASVEMTLPEADYLRRHLVQLLRAAGQDVSR